MSFRNPGRKANGSPVRLRGGCFWYLLLIAASAIFTQALRSPVSAVVFWFVLLLPVFDLIILLLSRPFIGADIDGGDRVLARGDRLSVAFRIRNRGLWPVSCVEVPLSVPELQSGRSRMTAKRIALPSFSVCVTDISVCFTSRGLFTVGIEELVLTDYLRLISIRKPLSCRIRIRVLPKALPFRRMKFHLTAGADAERNRQEKNGLTEYGDVREYRPGDRIKAIHWKLSTKTEELQIRQYTDEDELHVRIYADFDVGAESGSEEKGEGYPFPETLPGEIANRMAEEAYALAREAAAVGVGGTLFWQEKDGRAQQFDFSDAAEADALAYPLSEADGDSGRLSAAFCEKETSVFYVAAFLSSRTGSRLRRIADGCTAAAFTVCLLPVTDLLPDAVRPAYRRELEGLCDRLAAAGLYPVILPEREAIS